MQNDVARTQKMNTWCSPGASRLSSQALRAAIIDISVDKTVSLVGDRPARMDSAV
jgi:hypothetical protein